MAKKQSAAKIDLSKLVNTAEAARRTGYTDRHVRLLAMRGQIVAVKTGRDWLVNLESLLDHQRKQHA
jgi:excisionase family DNA binding protein